MCVCIYIYIYIIIPNIIIIILDHIYMEPSQWQRGYKTS